MTTEGTLVSTREGSWSSPTEIEFADYGCGEMQISAIFYAAFRKTYVFECYNYFGANNYNWAYTKTEDPIYEMLK